jgi:hypothetical protein
LREMLVWADTATAPPDAETNRAWQIFLTHRDLAHKILYDQEHPHSGDRTLSVHEPEVRCGKHGEWFDGYLFDMLIDPHSEIITQVDVLSANGDEAGDAVQLIRREEAAYGNDVKGLSIDGVGFNGPLLRQLEDPEGLHVDTYVPVPQDSKESANELFPTEDFTEDAERGVVTCPAGQTSQQR